MKFAVIAALATNSVSAYSGWGWCPLFTSYGNVDGFDPARYQGNWYVIKKDKDGLYDRNSDCVTATYQYDKDRWWWYPVNVLNRSYKRDEDTVGSPYLWGIPDWVISWARCDTMGNCNVKFLWWPEGNYQVMDTDYDTYSLVYGCDTWFGLYWTTNAWLLSRQPTLDQ